MFPRNTLQITAQAVLKGLKSPTFQNSAVVPFMRFHNPLHIKE